MVVFPAPSSPKMRILISRVPNKLEKMVEKKPPTKKKIRTESHFNVSWRYGDWPDFWLNSNVFPLFSEKRQAQVATWTPVGWTISFFPGLMPLRCCRPTQQNQVASSFLIVVRSFFLFSHLPKSEPTTSLFVLAFCLFTARDYTGPLWSLK